MRPYEIMIIFDPELEEAKVGPTLDRFLKIVTDADGAVAKRDIWGKRRLAYDILKRSEGIYAVVDFTATPEAAKELDRVLNLSDTVLRTKLLRVEPSAATRAPEPVAAEA
ncbi:MAG: 30S ribosomal protein S6 [Bifidobacteriaceae bacterium]|jgi:small subunit ribosomal protein S6|nr:30S ribosomal protein S6 [Bifidobacteriaceae bacterium]